MCVIYPICNSVGSMKRIMFDMPNSHAYNALNQTMRSWTTVLTAYRVCTCTFSTYRTIVVLLCFRRTRLNRHTLRGYLLTRSLPIATAPAKSASVHSQLQRFLASSSINHNPYRLLTSVIVINLRQSVSSVNFLHCHQLGTVPYRLFISCIVIVHYFFPIAFV